jgi:glucokinase
VTSKNRTTVLAGDIGGTKTNVGLFVARGARPEPEVTESFSSQDAPDLENILQRFMKSQSAVVESACFGIAGPVFRGRCKTTNLPWEVEEGKIRKRFGWPRVTLINDLEATAYAIPYLNSTEIDVLNSGQADAFENCGVLAPGTGLGAAFLIFQNGRALPIASEGGHMDFAPNDEVQVQLWRYLHRRYGHVSVERILSGPGLVNIYRFLSETKSGRAPEWLSQALQGDNPAQAISNAALNKQDALCIEALDLFVSILGAVAGNLALIGKTVGGLYLAGGIPPKIQAYLKSDRFMDSFIDKGRFKEFLQKVPVRIVLNEKTALLGAACRAFDMMDTE